MHSAFYLWTTPFWLAWYLQVTIKARSAKAANTPIRDGRFAAKPLA
jgi:hypothetical protein